MREMLVQTNDIHNNPNETLSLLFGVITIIFIFIVRNINMRALKIFICQ